MDEIVVEDFGDGIKDLEKFREFGQYSKADLGGEIIGMKGLGKLSLLRLGQNVNFRTNNGEYGIDIVMTPKDFDATMGGKEKYLSHQGTQIIIPIPKDPPRIEELAKYLEKVFGLRIARGIEIILNGNPLQSKLDKMEKFLCRLKGEVDVTGNLKQDKKGRGLVDLYVKHVYVSSLLVDPERNFTGWVNCNNLIPTTNRNEVVIDETYNDFLLHLRQYVAGHFPKREEEVSKDEILIGNELSKLLKNYLKDMKLAPQGSLLLGKGSQEAENANPPKERRKEKIDHEPKEEDYPEYVKQHTQAKTNKPIKRTQKTDYGVLWLDQDYGNEKEPLFFLEPNMVVKNRTNDLYKFALKNKTSLGPKWLRLLPYLSRVAVSIDKKCKDMPREQFNLEVDKACRYFLTRKAEL